MALIMASIPAFLLWINTLLATAYIYLRKHFISAAGLSDMHYLSTSDDGSVPSYKWLTKVLRACDSTVKVEELVCEDLRGNRGLSGSINRLRVKYSAPTDLPASFLIKRTQCGTHAKRSGAIFSGSCREATFYRNFTFENTPRVFHAENLSFTGEMIIIMEDLQGCSTGLNFYFGNQIWGMKPLDNPIAPEEVLGAVFNLAADMNARFWQQQSLLSSTWMKSAAWYRGEDQFGWQTSMNTARKFWNNVSSSISPNGPVKWEPRLVQLITASFAHTSWEALQAALQDPALPFTLTHGDFHASNMLLRHGDGPIGARLVLFDWSEVGPWTPATDLSQLMISDVKPAVRREHERALVEAYWRRLCNGGVAPEAFPLSACWQLYVRSGIERWIVLLVLLAGWGLPPAATQYFHDQVWAFVSDHGDQDHYVLKAVVRVNL